MGYFNWIKSKPSLFLTFYAMFLFFILTPNTLFNLLPKSSIYLSTLVHALIFGVIWQTTSHFVYTFAKKNKL